MYKTLPLDNKSGPQQISRLPEALPQKAGLLSSFKISDPSVIARSGATKQSSENETKKPGLPRQQAASQ